MKTTQTTNANLLERLVVIEGYPQHLDTDPPVTVDPLPHVGKPAERDRTFANFSEVATYDM